MPEESAFREALNFFGDLGVFDVVLPFLLIFTIVFAILEKTKIFGIEKIGEIEYTKKSLNAITALVIAFFTIASSKLVEIITEISSNMVIVLVALVFYLLLAGSFQQEKKEAFFLEGRTKAIFMVISFVALAAIFLNALTVNDGRSWLQWAFDHLQNIFTDQSVGSIVLVLVVAGIIWFITQGSGSSDKKEAKK